MTQYVNKNVLVAEIEKRLDELYDSLPNASDVIKDNYTKEEANITGKYTALESFENFINTLEVKEVDLEKVIEEYFKGWTDDYDNGGAACHYQYVQVQDCKAIAKRFFELGLKAQKGE